MSRLYSQEDAMRFWEMDIRNEVTEEVTKKVTKEVTKRETENAIRNLVEALREGMQSREFAAQMLISKYRMQPQAAADKVAQYWNEVSTAMA